jgi:hypothetical protein
MGLSKGENMLQKLLVSALILSSVSALAVGWVKVTGVGKVSQKGVVTIAADWLKDKDDKYDVNMRLTNDSDKTILLFVGDMKCGRGSDSGGNVDIHSDRRTIDLRTKESRDVVMTCRLMSKTKGDFNISFKVFDNPTSDSNTPGKVLAEGLTWKQGEHEGKPTK